MPATITETAASSVQARQRIRDLIYQTPLLPARVVGKDQKSSVLFKTENFQITGSFKLRGAMSRLTATEAGEARLITASSGNHGISVAYAAQKLGRDVTVVLPETVAESKLAKIRAYNVNVILHGAETGLAELHAQELARGEGGGAGYSYISPYNDPYIVAGQGTIGLELLEQCAQVDNVFVAVGGGGLMGGVGAVMKAISPRTKIWGVSASNTKALAESMVAGRVIETEHRETLADGVAGGMDVGSITLPLAIAVTDHVLAYEESEIRAAMKTMAFDDNMIVEGSAALALAGLQPGCRQSGQSNQRPRSMWRKPQPRRHYERDLWTLRAFYILSIITSVDPSLTTCGDAQPTHISNARSPVEPIIVGSCSMLSSRQ